MQSIANLVFYLGIILYTACIITKKVKRGLPLQLTMSLTLIFTIIIKISHYKKNNFTSFLMVHTIYINRSASDYNPANRGPIKNRGCTDILCLLIFIAFLVGWGVVGVYGFYYGNPMTLLYPSDSNGEICGRGNNEGRPYLFFFDITKCLKLSSAAFGCPTKQVKK